MIYIDLPADLNMEDDEGRNIARLADAVTPAAVGAGETMTVSFGIGLEQLGCWDVEEHPTRFAVEPDAFALYVGSSLHATQELTLEVL